MNQDRLKYLLELYAAKTATAEEVDEFYMQVMETSDADIAVLLTNMLENTEPQFDESRRQRLLEKILQSARNNGSTAPVHRIYPWTRIAAASVIVLLLSVSAYFYFKSAKQKQIAETETQLQRFKNDVMPGGNKAILTLANGRQIILDSAANGTLTQQGTTKIIKLDSGQLAYQAVTLSNGHPKQVYAEQGRGVEEYNTITTPRGGQYQIVLADGSKVWLNAASSLRYPTAFSGKERNVELTGEGYFEIAHNAAKPFHVKVKSASPAGRDMTVEVLGTHFNINAYSDETSIRTTLLEGSVKVTKGSAGKIIKPGEQAQIENQDAVTSKNLSAGGVIMVQTADIDEAVAWKNGRFIFQGNNIQSVMRQLARWYNVDVSYQGSITDEEFVGVINRSRYENISQILEMLEKTKTVSFAINGRSVTVMAFKE